MEHFTEAKLTIEIPLKNENQNKNEINLFLTLLQ